MAIITLEEIEALIKKDLEKAGIDLEKDHADTIARDKVIMELIEKTAQDMREYREAASRQCAKARDIAEIAKISKPSGYVAIRELNKELADNGYPVSRGIISKAYFLERFYCLDEPYLFMTVNDVMEVLPISQSEAYKAIRTLNKILVERGNRVFSGRVSKKIFREKFYGIEVVDAG